MTTEARSRLKRKSHVMSEGPARAGARAMLRAVGLKDEDMDKPFVAVANLASDVTPCNVHLDRLAQKVKQGVWDANGVPFLFGTITVSDGISMGTEGMKASLVSREVIADSIETVSFAESMDGLIVVAACDKNMPGAIMAMARLNIPALFVYGGHHSSRALRWQRHQHPGYVRGRWRLFPGEADTGGAIGHGARGLPWRGGVCRNVHRQHHGLGN